MNPRQLSKIVIKGFKSIKECDLELKDLNILIGANGAGKSNFLSFFRMIQQISRDNLQIYVAKQGGPDSLLYFGRKKTERLSTELYFGEKEYKFTLEPIQDNRMMFARETFYSNKHHFDRIMEGQLETSLESVKMSSDEIIQAMQEKEKEILQVMMRLRVYHLNDTSADARIKGSSGINDNIYLREDGRNFAAFLYLLKVKHETYYQRIVKTIRLVAPFFGDFLLRPNPLNTDHIQLEWTEKGEDTPFNAHILSDGTLRFICLATVLLQPEEFQPDTILIDEPELGLHPYAISVLAGLLRSVSKTKQIIVSTQSVELLNEFKLEDVIIADRTEEGTHLSRPDVDKFKSWIKEYSLGELWKTNLIGGRPSR